MDISEYNKLVGERIKTAMIIKGCTQGDLIEKCKELGLVISQPSLSRLLSSADRLDIYKVATICKVLDLRLDKALSFDSNEDIGLVRDEAFITDATDDAFQGYLGDYKGYFYSTLNDDVIHCGDFRFYRDSSTNRCMVSFCFSTGSNNGNNVPIRKEFLGTAKLSKNYGAICCELTAKDGKGDVSYIIFKYDFIANQQCVCKIGMVVTICAGFKRLPVAHKLLICSKELSEEDISIIGGQLKLNDDSILVSASDYRDFVECSLIPASFKPYIEHDKDLFVSKAANLSFYSFREDDILDIKNLPREDKAKVINLLRKYSNSKRCKKVGPKSEAFIFDYLKGTDSIKS